MNQADFERQLTTATRAAMGPRRPVDARHITQTAMTAAEGDSWHPIVRPAAGWRLPAAPQRRHVMFSALKLGVASMFVTLVSVLALNGVLTTPTADLDEAAAGPAAETLSVGPFTGTLTHRTTLVRGEQTIGDDRAHMRGAVLLADLEADDPRIEGTMSAVWNTDMLTEPIGTSVQRASVRVENQAGTWTGDARGFIANGQLSVMELQGHGAYEGLSALIFAHDNSKRRDALTGLVYAGELPELPEAAPAIDG